MRIKHLLSLIRFPNLLMLILTQFLVEYCLVIPVVKYNQADIQFSLFHFCLLVISTVLIAAGGYLINDYADIKIDKINKPEKVIIGKYINTQTALNVYAGLTLSGLATALYLAWHVKLVALSVIQIIVAGLLYFYAINYKRQLLIGNIIVSFLSALSVLLPVIYEAIAEIKLLETPPFVYFDIAYIYAAFAFMTTFIREIIKDIEDKEGDQSEGCNTLPIALGIKLSKLILFCLLVTTITGIAYFQNRLYALNENKLSQIYITFLLQLPLLYLAFKLIRAKEKKDYNFASLLIKLIMLSGILSMPFLFLLIYNLQA